MGPITGVVGLPLESDLSEERAAESHYLVTLQGDPRQTLFRGYEPLDAAHRLCGRRPVQELNNGGLIEGCHLSDFH